LQEIDGCFLKKFLVTHQPTREGSIGKKYHASTQGVAVQIRSAELGGTFILPSFVNTNCFRQEKDSGAHSRKNNIKIKDQWCGYYSGDILQGSRTSHQKRIMHSRKKHNVLHSDKEPHTTAHTAHKLDINFINFFLSDFSTSPHSHH